MHPAIAQVFQYFAYAHLPPYLQAVSKPFHDLAVAMIETLRENPELTVGLRKLALYQHCCHWPQSNHERAWPATYDK
jgi:hypothetical protein